MESNAPEVNAVRLGTSFQNLLKAIPDIVYVLDSKGLFVYLNDAIGKIGYTPEELIGAHFSEILFEEDAAEVSRDHVLEKIRAVNAFPEVPPKLFDERRSGARMTRDLEVRIKPKNGGSPLYASVNAYGEPVSDQALSALFRSEGPITMGIIHDVTAERMYRESLEENLAAKELLLREIHHRVKNNLQVIASLAHLREMETKEEVARATLSELGTQIKTMAMVHETLYQTENLNGVSARDYFERFSRFMRETYGRVGSPVTLETTVDDCPIDVGRLSYLAMIASELVSNAYRHAFPDNREGRIQIRFSKSDKFYTLTVGDDGKGIGTEKTVHEGLGLSIVEALASQLNARLERSAVKSGGSEFTLKIPLE